MSFGSVPPNRYLQHFDQLMRTISILFICVLLLSACKYKTPITTEHDIPVDQHVLGSWKIVPAENQDNQSGILIFRFSDTEYSVHYHEDGGNLYFRAYAINIDGVAAVQLEFIGSDDGPAGEDATERFHVISYQLENDQLKISTLNTELVDDKLDDSESLRKALIKHKENPDLFNEPGFFKRVPD